MRAIFEQTVAIKCTDNDKVVEADVNRFHEGVFLEVVMNTVKVNLQYDSRFEQYVGSLGGMEFITKGPRKLHG